MGTKIGWCHYTAQDGKLISGATLNPIKGCSHAGYQPVDGGSKKAHPGCQNCYAEKWVKGPYPGCSKATAKWDGTIEFFPERILWPFQKTGFTARKDGNKRIVFLCSESDMGHPNVPHDVWMAINGMMALSPWNIYKDLTKRPEVQAERLNASSPLQCVKAFMLMTGIPVSEAKKADIAKKSWSDLDHIHRYISVSDQPTLDAMVPELLKMPAAVKGISLEPMVRPIVYLERWIDKLDHVIAGGESGIRARKCFIWWLRTVLTVCRHANKPAFIKQLGSSPIIGSEKYHTNDPKGSNPAEWPEDLRVQMQVGEVWK